MLFLNLKFFFTFISLVSSLWIKYISYVASKMFKQMALFFFCFTALKILLFELYINLNLNIISWFCKTFIFVRLLF